MLNKRIKTFIYVLIMGVFSLSTYSCDLLDSIVNPRDILISYNVSGSAASATITYRNENKKMVTINNAKLPWSDIFYVSNGFTADLKASNYTGKTGLIARLYINGALEDESKGEFSVSLYKWVWINDN